ncbi:MAG: UDP-N-acetylglucosamine 2-epimerase (non-hydrolyzing) [Qipengyuania sp.]|nr:UDP-N-acetylglucosamine 2-epimerase (non-hydrolyzing) [Qipengyuania sp.]
MRTRKRIMLAFGTRPEAIKMAPVYRALRARPREFDTLCCVTAQHREMLDQALQTFDMVPDADLDLMRCDQDVADVNAAVLRGMRTIVQEMRPDLVLVHGDTTTSMASTLAAFYAGIAVGHVEAGLRSGDMLAPFPEELNRRVTGMIAKYHFAPTEASRANLLAEGCDPARVIVTGNTVVDALTYVLARIDSDRSIRRGIEAGLDAALGFDWRTSRYVLVTCHRRESLAHGLHRICAALEDLARAFPDTHFVYPVHPNPAVREPVEKRLTGFGNVHLLEPLAYDAFVYALRNCFCVLTDSGGLQEEGPALRKPVLVMRNVTERPEAVAAGAVGLVGTDRDGIVSAMFALLTDMRAYERMAAASHPFGDGTAGERIAAHLSQT